MQFKIRAWDKVNKRMQTWEELLAGKEFKAKLQVPEAFGLVLMLYSGMEDKNEKEICDGDIIRLIGNNELASVCYDAEGVFWIKSRHRDEYLRNWEGACEVIGNIYENPELIQKEGNPTTK